MLIDAWDPLYGGGIVHVQELCKNLILQYNYEIDLYVRSLKNKQGKIFNQNEVVYNRKLHIYRIGYATNFFNLFGRLSYLMVVFKIIKNHKKKPYDLIHSHAYFSIIPAKITSLITHLPLIFTVHGVGLGAWKEMKKGLGSKINYYLEKFLLTKIKCDHVITVSSDYLKLPNVNKNITVIPNGVDVAKFDAVSVPKDDKFKILFVGRLTAQKGLTYLIEAINIIKKKLEKTEVVIVGEGEEKEKILFLIKKYHLENITKLKNALFGENLIKEYKSSHLFVLPSIYEGQPLTLFEAWAAKLPVIATDVGDNKKYISEKNGYLIKAKNIETLGHAIIKAYTNNNLKLLGETGYHLIKKYYSWYNTVEKTRQTYDFAR